MKERADCNVKRSRRKNLVAAIMAFVAIAGLVALAFGADEAVRGWQVTKGDRPLQALAAACSRYGDWPPLAAGIALVAAAARMRRARFTVMVCALMLASSLLAGAIVNPLRAATGRARPSRKVEPGWYFAHHQGKWLVGKHAYSSFPSAHTTVAAALAVPLFLVGWRAGLGGLAIAAAIGWSRIYLGAHHPSDVLVGAVLGTACGLALVRSAAVRWWMWRAASAACGMRARWPRSCAVPWRTGD